MWKFRKGSRVVTPFGTVGRVMDTRLDRIGKDRRPVQKYRVDVPGKGDKFWFTEWQINLAH